TTIDGHQMALRGRAGPALGIAAIGSFFAGCVSTLLIAVAAPPLAAIALEFGPAEYFSLMVCGLIAAVVLAHGSLIKAIAMVVLGLLLGLAGTDVNSGVRRLNFGNGDIRGVAAPESANNAGAQTSFIPMLTLGIPGNPTMAMMIGALMIHGIAPGPRVMTERPGMFWGLIASMWIGNLMLVVLNLPMVGIWVRLLRVP